MSEMLTMMAQAPSTSLGQSLETGAFAQANRTEVAPVIDGIKDVASDAAYYAGRVAKPTLRTAAIVGVVATPAVALGTGEAQPPANQPTVNVESPTVTITGASAAARSVARADLKTRTVLAFRSPNGTSRATLRRIEGPQNKANCKLDSNFLNSGTADGQSRNTPTFFRDRKLTILCKSPTSPTGWIKVGLPKNRNVLKDGFQKNKDIIPGTDCENIANPDDKAKVRRIVTNPIVVRSFREAIGVSVAVKAEAVCAPGTYAYGYGSASAQLTVREYWRARVAPNGGIVNRLTGKAKAEAAAGARCESVVVTVPGAETVKDLCPNYPGVQVTIPAGALLGPDGMCGKDPNIGGETPPVNAPGLK